MSNSNLFLNVETKEYPWEQNAEDIIILQNEIDGLANAIQNRFFKEDFGIADGFVVLTSNGLPPEADNGNEINLYGYNFGMISFNMAIKSVNDATVKALYTYEFGFEESGGVYSLLGTQNQRIIYQDGANVDEVIIDFSIHPSGYFRVEVGINPLSGITTRINATVSVKVSSA